MRCAKNNSPVLTCICLGNGKTGKVAHSTLYEFVNVANVEMLP